IAQAGEPAGGHRDPERSLRVLAQSDDGLAGEAREAAVAKTDEAALGPDPEIAVAVGEEGVHLVVRQAIARGKGLPAVSPQAAEPAGGAGPEIAVPVDRERPDAVVGRPRDGFEGTSPPPEDPGRGADPQGPVAALGERLDDAVGELGHRLEPPPAQEGEPLGRPRPEDARAILEELLHEERGEAVGERPGRDPAPFAADQPFAVRGVPELSRAAGEQGEGRRTGVEGDEPRAVETEDRARSGQPEISVAGLDDRQHAVVGQAVAGAPGPEAVLADGARRVQRRGGSRGEEQANREAEEWTEVHGPLGNRSSLLSADWTPLCHLFQPRTAPSPALRHSASRRSPNRTGLARKSSIPAARQASRCSSITFAVIATMRGCRSAGSSARMRRVASSPSISGICTSIRTRS